MRWLETKARLPPKRPGYLVGFCEFGWETVSFFFFFLFRSLLLAKVDGFLSHEFISMYVNPLCFNYVLGLISYVLVVSPYGIDLP